MATLIPTVMTVLRSGGDFKMADVLLLSERLQQQWKSQYGEEETLQVICLTDVIKDETFLKNVHLIPLPNPQWRGWWAKMNIFHPMFEKYRPFLFMDLDTAIVGPIGDFVIPRRQLSGFITLEDFHAGGKRLASALMWLPLKSEKLDKIWKNWIGSPGAHSKKYRGDQDFLRAVTSPDALWQYIPETKEKLSSFKPNRKWLYYLPANLSIVCFHGSPRVPVAAKTVSWVKKYRDGGFETEQTQPVTLHIPSVPTSSKPVGEIRFSLLCPTRGRPFMALKYARSALQTATHPEAVEILMYVDGDDPSLKEYQKTFQNLPVQLITGTSRGVGAAWNALAKRALGHYFIMGNDDLIHKTPGWDDIIWRKTGRFSDEIVLLFTADGIKDGTQCCFPIVSNKWVQVLGEYLPEYYNFFYHDTDLHDIALQIGDPARVCYIKDVMIYHDHCRDTRAVDATHLRNRGKGQSALDADIYKRNAVVRAAKASALRGHIGLVGHFGESSLSKMIAGKRVALVGPSPHLIGGKLGEEINSYDVICRVNELFPFGMEVDYGNRTDILFHCGNRYSIVSLKRAVQKAHKDHSAVLDSLKAFVWAQKTSDNNTKLVVGNYQKFFARNLPWVELMKVSSIKHQFWTNRIGTHPNSGIVALCMIAECKPSELFLTGFSFYSQGFRPDISHNPSYMQYAGGWRNFPQIFDPEKVENWAELNGHPQEPQKRWFVEQFFPEYKDILRIDSFLADLLKISHNNVSNLSGEPDKTPAKAPEILLVEANQRWTGDYALKHQFTYANQVWVDPDGPRLVKELVGDGKVCEIGCGIGRVAALFPAEKYIGVDVGPQVIATARQRLPSHAFDVIGYLGPYPEADVYLFHMVLLHIPDIALPEVIAKLSGRVVVFESMDFRLRDGVANFQRNPEQYIQAFKDGGFELVESKHLPSKGKPGFRDYLVFQKGDN